MAHQKKGLPTPSSIIATIFLIGFILALGAAGWYWAKGGHQGGGWFAGLLCPGGVVIIIYRMWRGK